MAEEEATVDEFVIIDNAESRNNNNEISDVEIADSGMTSEAWRRDSATTSEMIAELGKALEEEETRVEILEREAKCLKETNAKSEMKVRELERKLLVSEMKQVEERCKRVRVEEDMRERILERQRKVEELDEKLRESEEREKQKDWVVIGLRERVKEAERMMRGLTTMTGTGEDDDDDDEEEEEEEKGITELQWSLGFAGAVATMVAALMCLWSGKRKSSSHLIGG